jgi:type III pantothenate kinase
MDFQSIALPTELRYLAKCGCKYIFIFIIRQKKIYKIWFCKFTAFICDMNLIIDVGNTSVKLAIFNQGKLIFKKREPLENLPNAVDDINKAYIDIKKTIIASVGNLKKSDVTYIKKHFKIIVLDASAKIPFQNQYKSPETLGVDRIALVSASIKNYNKQNVLIIDAGTCITYDFINSENKYLGGAISPGIRVRYQSLNNLTANLPLLETKAPHSFIGNSTTESIHSGIINGILNEIEGTISKYDKKYKDLTVILTGGDADFLSKQLKSSIFANSNFLLEGLNYILEFNTN